MDDSSRILCFGEIVWDAMPAGIFLGGAPFNVAYHLSRHGNRVYPVSRIGRDFLGDETLRRMKAAGLSQDLIQVDEEHPTGAVVIELNEAGDADYEILENAAWDYIQPDPPLLDAASGAEVLVYGTLSTRGENNARLLGDLVSRVPFRLCDVNLRKPYDSVANALSWASRATVVKLNEEELLRLAPAGTSTDLQAKAEAFAAQTGVETVIVTMAGRGAFVWHDGESYAGTGPKVEVADTVGAGDAFTAGFISRYLASGSLEKALQHALKVGSFVAGCRGAQPEYSPDRFN